MNQIEVKKKFIEFFKTKPILVKAPGRINLIGEHTDYNNGYVLPAAINKDIYLALQKNNKNLIRIFAVNLDESIEISANKIIKNNADWANYLLGSYSELIKDGNELQGFDCVFGGDLPIGAGLSSSAAIECGLIYGLNHLYDLNIDNLHIAKLAQKAENNFVGVNCGIMDQYAIMHGKKDNVIQLDCRSLNSSYSPYKLNDYSIVLVNSNVKHSLATSEYNTRRSECDTGVQILQKYLPAIKSLRDVSLDEIKKYKHYFNSTIYNRCLYIIEENERVLKFCTALEKNNDEEIGNLLYSTHLGLKNQYEVSCIEIDLLVQVANEMDYVLGSRMMGGGFGGCTLNLVQKNKVELFTQTIQEIYTSKIDIKPSFYNVEITNGIEIIN